MSTFKKNIKLGTMDPLWGTEDIANSSVTTEKIKDGAVTDKKIKDGSITKEKLAFEIEGAAEIAELSRKVAAIGDLSQLKTTSKGTLVSAINESAVKTLVPEHISKLASINYSQKTITYGDTTKDVQVVTNEKVFVESAEKDVYLVADTGDVYLVAPQKGITEPVSLTEVVTQLSNLSGKIDGVFEAIDNINNRIDDIEYVVAEALVKLNG